MSKNFKDYSKFYDLLYLDKDYSAEVDFVDSVIKSYCDNSKTVLDVGCGTGIHLNLLSQKNYDVSGIDLSVEMISEARRKYPHIDFSVSNGQSFNIGKKFDIITSLFHVLSYQNTNEEVANFINQICDHLNEGGLGIIDYWYGPAVLNLKPESRIKEVKKDNLKIKRYANTELDYFHNIATVHYKTLCIEDNYIIDEIEEAHPMRFYFTPEIEFILKQRNVEILKHSVWMKHDELPSENSWSAYTVFKKLS